MNFDFFYGTEAEQFQFYRIPQILFTDDKFKKISSDAKILYGLLLDRIGLSFQNPEKFNDDNGRAFIFFTRETTMEMLNCGKEKSAQIFQELENAGLIERKRQGLGKPTKIYVKNIFRINNEYDKEDKSPKNPDEPNTKPDKSNQQKAEEPTSRGRKNRPLEDGKTDLKRTDFPDTNHTDINHTDMNQTNLISQSISHAPTSDKPTSDKPDGQTDRQKKISFNETLIALGCTWMPNIKKESELSTYDEAMRQCNVCSIPYELKGNPAAIKHALQFLSAYSYYAVSNSDASNRLILQVISCIAEMLKNDTYQVQGMTIKYYEIIDRLNELIQEDALTEWFFSFETEWEKILSENNIKYQKAYMKSCIWNWLNEFQFVEDNSLRQLDYARQHSHTDTQAVQPNPYAQFANQYL